MIMINLYRYYCESVKKFTEILPVITTIQLFALVRSKLRVSFFYLIAAVQMPDTILA